MAAAFVLAVTLTACGARDGAVAGKRKPPKTSTEEVVLSIEPAPPLEELPPRMCFAAVESYDVMLLGDRLGREDACAALAERLFPGAAQLPWSPTALENPDTIVECFLTREEAWVEIWRADPDVQGPRFERAYELTEAGCEALEAEGWRRASGEEWMVAPGQAHR